MNPKSHRDRATWSTFWLLLGAGIVWKWPGLMAYPYAVPVLAGACGLAMLYFVVGVVKATAEPDPMGRFWPFLFAVGSGFLIWKYHGGLLRDWPYLNVLLNVLLIATCAASSVRLAVAMKRMPNKSLPHPSKVPLMPMAGAASKQAAHAALTRGRIAPRPWWKFW
jgi:hypothetical protein